MICWNRSFRSCVIFHPLREERERKETMTLQEEILELKKRHNAVILAHNYVGGEVQDIADFSGDSLELSIRAKNVNAPLIVFCGVRFMAETAKLLSPDSTVLLPDPDAGCPMANMASALAVKAMRQKHPDAVYCAYVNSTAETKSQIDICCTSGNVENVLNSIPAEKEIVFLPDRNLGANMGAKLNRNMILWDGCCPVHDAVTPESIRAARTAHPGAEVLIHPECRPETIAECDKAMSTGGILRYVKESDKKEFIIATEYGIMHRLKKENPGKEFYHIDPPIICRDMKMITLEQVRDSLRDGKTEVILPADVMRDAVKPIEKMIALPAK